jgi:hypothetical protein
LISGAVPFAARRLISTIARRPPGFARGNREVAMTGADYSRKLDELDRLLNDPDLPLEPDRVWSLLAEVSRPDVTPAHELEVAARVTPSRPLSEN